MPTSGPSSSWRDGRSRTGSPRPRSPAARSTPPWTSCSQPRSPPSSASPRTSRSGARGGSSFDSPEVGAAYTPAFGHPAGDVVWTQPDPDELDTRGEEEGIRLIGPAGWLQGLAGRVVGFERRGRVWVWVGEVAALAEGSEGSEVSEAGLSDMMSDVEGVAAATLRATVAERDATYLPTAWLQAIQDEADRRAPAPLPRGVLRPVSELASVAGVSVRGHSVAVAGYDWGSHEARRLAADLAAVWGVETSTTEDFGFLVGLVESLVAVEGTDGSEAVGNELVAAAVSEPRVRAAFGHRRLASAAPGSGAAVSPGAPRRLGTGAHGIRAPIAGWRAFDGALAPFPDDRRCRAR